MENTNSGFRSEPERGIFQGHREVKITDKEEGKELTTENVGPGASDREKKFIPKSKEVLSERTPVFDELKKIDPEEAEQIDKKATDEADIVVRKENPGISPEELPEKVKFLKNLYKEELAVEAMEKKGKKPTIH